MLQPRRQHPLPPPARLLAKAEVIQKPSWEIFPLVSLAATGRVAIRSLEEVGKEAASQRCPPLSLHSPRQPL